MNTMQIALPELGLIAGTRAALGVGIGLLIADHLSAEQRRAAGWTLLLTGVITTVPLVFEVMGKMKPHDAIRSAEASVGGSRT